MYGAERNLIYLFFNAYGLLILTFRFVHNLYIERINPDSYFSTNREEGSRMNQPFNKKDYEDLVKNECFFKLSFRADWQKSTKDGSLTYYGFLLSQNNQQSNYSS